MFNPIVRLELYKKISGEYDYNSIYNTTPVVINTFLSVTSTFDIIFILKQIIILKLEI